MIRNDLSLKTSLRDFVTKIVQVNMPSDTSKNKKKVIHWSDGQLGRDCTNKISKSLSVGGLLIGKYIYSYICLQLLCFFD